MSHTRYHIGFADFDDDDEAADLRNEEIRQRQLFRAEAKHYSERSSAEQRLIDREYGED